MSFRVRITQPAKLDTREYAAFIRDEQKSPTAARRWLDGLHEAIKELANQPERFSVIPEADELGSPYRSFVYHSHRVIYAVDYEERTVTVHRVYHGARRPLKEDELP